MFKSSRFPKFQIVNRPVESRAIFHRAPFKTSDNEHAEQSAALNGLNVSPSRPMAAWSPESELLRG